MPPLSGLGIWIWQLSQCEHGNVDAIIAKAKSCGVAWLAIKAGENHSNGQVTKALVDKLRGAGIVPVAWWYCLPGAPNTTAQLSFLAKLRADTGVEHFICDAEIEWEQGEHRAEAATFAQELQMAVGFDAYLADAPWPIATLHPTWPWAQFGAVMAQRHDQLYWREAGQPFTVFAHRADAAWSQQPKVPARCPIGSTVNDAGEHAPISELAAFLDHYALTEARSLWSWQHLSADEWALLKERATPPTVPTPLPAEA